MASTVRGIVSDAIHTKLNDPRIADMSSVTRVEMSGDLQVARVFISVYGSDAVGRRTMAGLRDAAGRIQRFVAKGLHVRNCPEIRLELDDSIKLANETLSIIERSLGAGDDAEETPADIDNGPRQPDDMAE